MHGRRVPSDVSQHHLLPRRVHVLWELHRGARPQLCRLLYLPAQHVPGRTPAA